MVQTQWEKQTGLCLRKQMQQASAKSYFAHFKDKKQKSRFFRRKKERERSLQRSHVSFSFLRYFLRFPFPLPTHTESTNPDVHKNTSLGTAMSYAMLVQQEEMHGNPAGPIVMLQNDVQTALQRQQGNWRRSLFLHRESFMGWTLFRGPEDLETQCLQKMWLLTGSSGHAHPRSLSF